MEDLLIVGCALIIITLLITWIIRSSRSPLDHFPHPQGWPIFGNMFQINSSRPELVFTEWSKKYGDVFSLKFFNRHILVLNSCDAIYEALVKRGHDFAGRPQDKAFRSKYISENFRDIINADPNPRWQLLRKMAHRSIRMYASGMKRIEAINTRAVKKLMDDFQDYQGRSFDPNSSIHNAVMNVIATLLIEDNYSQDDELFKLICEVERLAVTLMNPTGRGRELDVLPWLRFLGHPVFKGLMKLDDKRQKAWHIMKKAAVVSSEDGHGFNYKGMVGNLFKEFSLGSTKDVKLEENHLKLASLNMIVAGTVTTSSSFYCYLNIISQHPHIQKNLQNEVNNVVGHDRIVTLSDKNAMPYTQATLYELLRFSSIVPLALPHSTLTETSLCGKSVPKGILVVVNLWALHHDEAFWQAPFEFKPERFLDDDGNLVSASHNNRKHLMPFGCGLRVCIGEILAINRLFMFIASTSQRFTITQGDKQASCDPRTYNAAVVLYNDAYEIRAQYRK